MKYKITYLRTGPIIERSKSKNFEQALSYQEARREIAKYHIDKTTEILAARNYEDYLFNVLCVTDENK